jgi:hypothetical protein
MTKQVQKLFDIEYKARERGRKALRGEPMKQRPPMKPILGWLVESLEGYPVRVELTKAFALPDYFERVVAVEIRERPKPRARGKRAK